MTVMTTTILNDDFKIPLIAVDDHKEEMAAVTREARKWNIRPRVFETASEWVKQVQRSDFSTILISDNLLPGVNDLDSFGLDGVNTAQGEEAGLRLLTTYCDRMEISSGLRILFTQFQLTDQAKKFLDKRNSSEVSKVHLFYKNSASDIEIFHKLIRDFSSDQKMIFIRDKIEYVKALGVEWGLSHGEVAALFGLRSERDPFWIAAAEGTTSLDFERRCDLVYRVKINLVAVYGKDNLVQESNWLRTRLSVLGNRSPLDYIGSQGIERLYSLVSVMEGNH